ncbi:hypothetical protein, conserved [Leishmania tarentolae]|uniref:Transmembrane protein n=1 Tax=Leishmania tarentolae TaxID=5689 RepID=A0A640KTY1_LEITA|nr:hypothetical protein, conserved [Leishmania tarentolae]
MSESTSSGHGTTPRNLSPVHQSSDDPAADHCCSSISVAEGGRSHALYHAAEAPSLSPVALSGESMSAMDAGKPLLSASSTSLDSAPPGSGDSGASVNPPVRQSGTDDVGDLKSTGLLRPLSVSTYPTPANTASLAPALSSKNFISLKPEKTLLPTSTQPVAHSRKLSGAASEECALLEGGTPPLPSSASESHHSEQSDTKVVASSSDSLTSSHAKVTPLPYHSSTDMRTHPSTHPIQRNATPTEPPITVRDASPIPEEESGDVSYRSAHQLPSQPHQSTTSSVQAHNLSMVLSDTSHGASTPPLILAPRPPTSQVCEKQRSSQEDTHKLRSDNPPEITIARTTQMTPLALLVSCYNNNSNGGGSGEGDKENRRSLPAKPSFSSSSISPPQSDICGHPPPTKQPSPLPPPAPTPIVEPLSPSAPASSPSQSTSGHEEAPSSTLAFPMGSSPRLQKQQRWERPAAADLVHFAPLIQQFDFRKRDIKSIADTSVFRMDDVNTVAVNLQLLRHEVLGRAEPIANIQQAAIRAGRVKALKPKRSGKPRVSVSSMAPSDVAPELPRVINVSDFHDTLAVFDNPILSISFALWGSVAPYNDLVKVLQEFCAPSRCPHRGGKGRPKNGDDDASEAERHHTEALSPAARKAHRWVRFSSVLRFLNHCGVDVLVTSPDRKAASSFCARRLHIHQHGRRLSLDVSPATPPRRVLVALCYDCEKALWCPLTTSRPILQVALQWREYQRALRLHTRRKARHGKDNTHTELHPAPNHNQSQQRNTDGTDAVAESSRHLENAEDGASHVVVTIPGDSPSDGNKTPSLKSGKQLPFHAVLYPNLVQTDLGFLLLFRQSLHPLFRTTCVRLTVGVLVGCAAVLLGIGLIVYATKTTDICLVDVHTSQCVDVGSSGNSGSFPSNSDSSCLAMLLSRFPSAYRAGLSYRYMYGPPTAPGKCLVVSICCAFAALLDNILIVYFAIRYIALGGIRPCFFHVLHGVQAVLGAIGCAFAAYVLSVFRTRLHMLPCAVLVAGDAMLCAAHLESCSNRYAYGVHGPLGGTNVALVLACVYLVLCVLHWLVTALPVLPSIATQDLIPTATPDTYTFRPSLFAPDGPLPTEVDQLRQAMQQPLRQELRHDVQARGRLLTTTTTIGEVMQANRVKSLKMTELNEERRRKRSRLFQPRSRDGYSRQRAGEAQRGKRQRYMVIDPGSKRLGNHRGSSSSSLSSFDVCGDDSNNLVVLAPRLMQRVVEIGSRVQNCALPSSTVNPLKSGGAMLSGMSGEGKATSLRVSPPSRHLVGPHESSSGSGSATRARVVAVTHKESLVSKSDSDLALQNGEQLRPALPSGRLFASTDLVASPTSTSSTAEVSAQPAASSVPVSKTSAHTSSTTLDKGDHHPSESHPATMTSVRSTNVSVAVSPTADMEIDRIAARVRARKDALTNGAR